MCAHVRHQAPPIDILALRQDEVRDVAAVMALPLLDEDFGPDELGRADQGDAKPEHMTLSRMREPLFLDWDDVVARTENDVDEIIAVADLSNPALVHH